MVDLAQLSQSNSYAQTSGPGFGTRMLCRPLDEHDNGPADASMWLTGLRRANALSMNTNDIPNAHMRSPGGFIEFFAGLTDPGDIQFEACWKNDVPRSAVVVYTAKSSVSLWAAGSTHSDMAYVRFDDVVYQASQDVGVAIGEPSANPTYWDVIDAPNSAYYDASMMDPDFQRWQAPAQEDTEGNIGFFHSIFYNRKPFEAWVIPPQWTRGLIVVRGYAKMVGPFPHEMEGVINFQGAFKASGKPMLLRGQRLTKALPTVAAVDSRIRWIKDNLLEEQWTDRVKVANTLVWSENEPAAGEGYFYEYTEDEGFGEAF